jgi:hypothetical protein
MCPIRHEPPENAGITAGFRAQPKYLACATVTDLAQTVNFG